MPRARRASAGPRVGDVLAALGVLHRRGDLPPHWIWVLVGKGPEREPLERALHLLGAGASGHVLMPGWLGERLLHALYARADVFLHAPRYEGSSLVTLEAMAHGLPVVATRTGGIPDKVVDGQTGCLVEPGDVTALAAALAGLAGDGALRARLGRAGRECVHARFRWPVLVERTLNLYDQLLRARPA